MYDKIWYVGQKLLLKILNSDVGVAYNDKWCLNYGGQLKKYDLLVKVIR